MMSTQKIDGWEITPETGTGKGPEFNPIQCYLIVGPYVRTETRVDRETLKYIVPPDIYAQIKLSKY